MNVDSGSKLIRFSPFNTVVARLNLEWYGREVVSTRFSNVTVALLFTHTEYRVGGRVVAVPLSLRLMSAGAVNLGSDIPSGRENTFSPFNHARESFSADNYQPQGVVLKPL